MRNAGVYLVQAQLGPLKYINLPPGEILFTLRIGRNYNSLSLASLEEESPRFIGILQLNVDSSALEAQRCSLSLNLNTPHDKRMLGIALVSLPKDKNVINSSYRLTQSQDKKAEIQLKIKINPLESSSLKNTGSIQINSDSGRVEEPPAKPENSSNGSSYIKMKSKKSSEEETEKKAMKNYKIAEEDKVLEVNEKELRRYKQEKEAYYQMYQIEKSKNEVAAKFISTVIKKLTEKYPELLQGIQLQSSKQSLLVPNPEIKKKSSELPKNRHPADVAAIAQLEQANRSLHRQVEEYKRIVEQLNNQISSAAKLGVVQKTKNNNASSAFDQMFGIRQPSKDKVRSNNILPASLKDVQEPEEGKDAKQALAGVDLKKWLEISIGQRQEMMARFAQNPVPAEPIQGQATMIRRLRTGFNKAFAELLGHKEYTRPVLLSHKQEMNRILEECVSV